MIVMKFGGTSIDDAPSIERVVEIVRPRLHLRPVVVNSAMGKTTRKLLAIAQLSAAGMDGEAAARLNEIRRYHFELSETLISNFDKSDTRIKLEQYFEDLQKLLGGLSILRELTLRSQDKILSYGELMATAIIASVFRKRGINARLCDARDFIITNERFSQAEPIKELSYKRIYEHIHPIVESNSIPVIQGFIGSTRDGATTTLGFEGSDFSASLIGSALNASSIQIWKDVSGIMTADPSIFAGARTVKTISFAEAEELTFFGAKILHPSTIEPARQKNIPVHIYNSKQPDAVGTIITAHPNHGTNLIKSITYKKPVCIMYVKPDNSVSPYVFLKSVFDILDRERIIPYVITTAEANVALAISDTGNREHLAEDLEHFGKVSIIREKATISLVGENLRTSNDFATTVFKNLDGLNIDMISFGASPINFTLVVDEIDVSSIIAKLHEIFFQDPDPEVFE